MKPEDAPAPAVGSPVERGVRPRALLLAHTDGRETLHPMSEYAVAYRDTAVSEALLYAMPRDLADYLLRHLVRERQALVGFTKLGNEISRAKRLDDWIAALGA